MSLRNRARSLQKKTGLSYQQALNKLRALGESPAQLSKKTGWPLEVCDRYLTDGHAPIDVIEVAAPTDPIAAVCETLRAMANARSVVFASADGRILARVGREAVAARANRSAVPPAVVERWSKLPDCWELDDGITLYTTRFTHGLLVVQFHRDESSLGLVKLRVARAVEQLERLIVDRSTPPLPPAGGRGGPGGLPAEVRVVAPKPVEPKKKKKR
jgi:hypothetical protein